MSGRNIFSTMACSGGASPGSRVGRFITHRAFRSVISSLLLFLSVVPLLAQVQITEFMASNSQTLRDDFGQYEDWIELYNNSADPVNLLDWALTDNPDNLFKWRFPSTNLPPKTFLVVFASNRDRHTPGPPLHTNFKLGAEGEYLALVRPDGILATRFPAPYPTQAPDVSFGFGVRTTGDLLVTTNSTGRLRVPTSGSLGTNWIAPDFNDSSWRAATNGIGFETGQSDDPATVFADILADSPAGYWRLSDPSGSVAVNSGSLGTPGNGQWLGGVTLGVPGPRPSALPGFEPNNLAVRLNGVDGRAEIPYAPEFNPAGPFTVETWVKPARAGGPAAWIVSSLNVAGGRNGYALAQDYTSKNQWEFRLGDSSGYIAMAYGGTVDTNNWQHLAGVYDGTTARLYVNGVLSGSSGLGRPFEPNTAQKTLIGGRVDAANPYYYAGDVDEVAIIARALSAAEIAARFQMATNTVPPTGTFNYTGLIQTDLRSDLLGVNSSAYLRLSFVVTNVAGLGQLKLRAKYDDGFAAWINGVPVVTANAPATPAWNSTATARHSTGDALKFAEFDVSAYLGSLRNGTNVLALQGLNLVATNTDFLLLSELEAASAGDYQTAGRYFVTPTPGAANGVGAADLGPILTLTGHVPNVPGTNDSLTITCRVVQAFAPVTAVTLNWRVMFNALNQTPMFDDGLHGDGAAGDGIYGAVIPNQVGATRTYNAGEMVRWYITASDAQSRASRWPLFESPTESAEYLGTVVQPDYVTSKLPVFHLFAPPTVLQPGPNTQQIGADSESGGRVALFYDGEFYDNMYMELRGNTSAGLNKKAHRLEFNREHPFRHPGPGGRIRKSSLLAEHLDPAYIRQHLSFWLLDAMGVPSPFDYPVRTQLNGAFYQLAFHTDVLGDEQLERLGYDPEGALYKCVGTVDPQFNSTGGFQKLLPKTNLFDRADYLQLANGINETKPVTTRRATVFDLLDVAEVVNYLAGARFCSENDDVWANMCFYRDTYGDGLWRIVPFDMNASWGQLYGGSSPLQANVDSSKSHPFYGGSQVQENGSSAWNRLYDVIVALPETRDMLRRRERSLLDKLVLPPGSAPGQFGIENYIKQLTNQISIEANLDRAKWGYSPWAGGQNFTKGINDLYSQFLPLRRTHWYVTHCITNTAKPLGLGSAYNAGLPVSQPTNARVSVVAWDYNPISGNQDQEYVCLTNENSYAVDVSGWKLGGGISHKLQPGTVIPVGGLLYLSPNVAAFRARASSPKGGMGLFVQGSYNGHLNAWGESLTLTDTADRLVSSTNFVGVPSLAQQYLRVTEIMYNPAPLTGSTNDPLNFEYLKLKNISTNLPLDLAGVRLTNGVFFAFSGSAVASLLPGQTVLVVRDTNAFALRYGSGFNIAGQFAGSLDNAGETLRLEDAVGEKVLEFAYNNTWYPITDGLGFSLLIVDDRAPWSTWGEKASWHANGVLGGSPGLADPQQSMIPPIRVNEVLAHSDPPLVDAIELYNPTSTNVSVGNWFLTDEFYSPKKFQIPAGRTISPGGFLVITDDEFAAGSDGFRLSEYGEQVYLFSADAARNLTGYVDGFDFGASPNDVSFGRYVTSQGEEHYVLQSANTLGTNNALPRVGPVVISEIMYRPPDLTNGTDNDLDEFIELQNITSSNVPLYCTFTNEPGYGRAALTNTWRLRQSVDYDFPTNTTLTANSRLLVVGFNPTNVIQLASFRARYSVPTNLLVLGPWIGKLDNSGEAIELKSPDKPDVTASNVFVPYVLIDKIHYRDSAPWPTNVDGSGNSLQRLALGAYGNDPTNWFGALPTAGQVVVEPLWIDVSLRGTQINLSVASSQGLTYSMEYKNDLAEPAWTPLPPPIEGTGSILVFTDNIAVGTNRFYRIKAH